MLREQEIGAGRNLVDNHVAVMKEATLYVGVTTMEQEKGSRAKLLGYPELWSGKDGLARGKGRKRNSIYGHRAMVFENTIKKGLTSVKFGRSVKRGKKPRKAFWIWL